MALSVRLDSSPHLFHNLLTYFPPPSTINSSLPQPIHSPLKNLARKQKRETIHYRKWTIGDTSNVVLSKEAVSKILDKLESLSVAAFFSGREDAMRNAGLFDTFLKNAQRGEAGSIVVYEVHEDGGIGRNKYTFDGENMYVLYVGSVWNEGKDVISIDTTYTRIKEWNYTKDGWFTREYCVPEPPEVSETVDGRFRIFLVKMY